MDLSEIQHVTDRIIEDLYGKALHVSEYVDGLFDWLIQSEDSEIDLVDAWGLTGEMLVAPLERKFYPFSDPEFEELEGYTTSSDTDRAAFMRSIISDEESSYRESAYAVHAIPLSGNKPDKPAFMIVLSESAGQAGVSTTLFGVVKTLDGLSFVMAEAGYFDVRSSWSDQRLLQYWRR